MYKADKLREIANNLEDQEALLDCMEKDYEIKPSDFSESIQQSIKALIEIDIKNIKSELIEI